MPEKGRPLALSLRRDLQTARESFAGRMHVVVKDPVGLRYYRFLEEEFALLKLLDGRRSLLHIQAELESRFAPQKFSVEFMSKFVADQHRAGLIVAEFPGQAVHLLDRRVSNRRRRLFQKLASPLSIRLRGIDPTWLLDRMYPAVRWCFSKAALAGAGLLIVFAFGLMAIHYSEAMRRLPTWQEFFTPANLLVLLVLTGAIKVLHELGHGLTCRHFGGEVPTLGLMFLVFAPCLYCDVSDAWRLQKRARLAIAAAGIFVELVLASLAALGWWLSEPGLFHQFCLGTMFLSGVSTLLINGNPLMRYDGYFLLSAWTETPNLAEKSTLVLRRGLSHLCFGFAAESNSLPAERHALLLGLYGVASALYRVALSVSIVLFLMTWSKAYDLEVAARLYALVAIGGFLVRPLAAAARFASGGQFGKLIRSVRGRVAVLVGGTAIAVLFLQPFPRCVWGTLEVEPVGAQQVYVDVPGVVERVAFQPGARVQVGEVLAELTNIDLALEIARISGQVAERHEQLSSLYGRRFHDDTAALEIPEVEETIAALKKSLEEKRADSKRLVLRSMRTGILLPAGETSSKSDRRTELPEWTGLPTDPRNVGATFSAGTLFCQVGDPAGWEALIVIDQTEIQSVVLGQKVELRLDQLPERLLAGRVEEISHNEIAESPRRLSQRSGGELATETDEQGRERPISSSYRVRVTLLEPPATLRIGLRGTARIHVDPEPLAARCMRWMSRTFHFQL